MRRFVRSVTQVAVLAAAASVVSPAANRLAAQNLQFAVAAPSVNADSSAVTFVVRDSAGAPAADAPVANIRAPKAGASMTGLRSAVHAREVASPLVAKAAAGNANLGQARALMIVGAAALVTGAIIGDDPGTIIMVGGAVVGLYGLYQYLQ
jgi:hypothetical protein